MGCLVGRYANRIGEAKFAWTEKHTSSLPITMAIPCTEDKKGFDKAIWAAQQQGDSALVLNHTSKDGEEGYPGNLQVQVVYTLTPANELKIDYSAETDQATAINLTNHTYFNLSGQDRTPRSLGTS